VPPLFCEVLLALHLKLPLFRVYFPVILFILLLLFFFFFFFGLFRAAPVAYGDSQARGPIGAVAAGLRQSHSDKGSEPRLRPTPQLTATRILNPLREAKDQPASSWVLVRLVSTEPGWELLSSLVFET